jgi:hypothetical protein
MTHLPKYMKNNMEIQKVKIDLPNGVAFLLFRKYNESGDWICQMEDDHMTALQAALDTEYEH